MKTSGVFLFLLFVLQGALCVRHHPQPKTYREALNRATYNRNRGLLHTCIHDHIPFVEPSVTQQNYAIHPRNAHDEQADLEWQPIRVKVNYDLLDNDEHMCTYVGQTVTMDDMYPMLCTAADILTENETNFLKNEIVTPSLLFLEYAYSVRRVQGNLIVATDSCHIGNNYLPVPVPENYHDPGVRNADLMIFVTARPVESIGVLAFAGQCEMDSYGRPTAGQINFNPAALVTTAFEEAQAVRQQEQLRIAVHEIHHILGFSRTKFPAFIDPDTMERRDLNEILDSIPKFPQSSTYVEVLKTPQLMNFTRQYFDCTNELAGIPLEDGGGPGTAHSHWEKRVLMNEFMTGTLSVRPAISSFTLALMEDSGWYRSNHSLAEPLYWGSGKGCDFVSKRCDTLWDVPSGEFCDEMPRGDMYGCNYERISSGWCNNIVYATALPEEFRYFSSSTWGGFNDIADYCPFYDAYGDGDCRYAGRAPGQYNYGTKNCPDCRCFVSTTMENRGVKEPSGECYKTKCVSADELKVQIGDIWYSCPSDSHISAVGFNGTLTCPTASENFCVLRYFVGNDEQWPILRQISPESGPPGGIVTITGEAFTDPMQVSIGGVLCLDVEVESSDQLSCKIAPINTLDIELEDILSFDFSNNLDEPTYVVIRDGNGRTDVKWEMFTIDMGGQFGDSVWARIWAWLAANLFLTIVIIVSVAVVIAAIIFLIYVKRKRKRVEQERAAANAKAAAVLLQYELLTQQAEMEAAGEAGAL